jgi:hypothetical protein
MRMVRFMVELHGSIMTCLFHNTTIFHPIVPIDGQMQGDRKANQILGLCHDEAITSFDPDQDSHSRLNI